MSKTLLFVDDEKQILKAIRRLYLDSDYCVYTADSGEEALKILDNTKVDVIVVDMKMPTMDGYELLKRVKQKYPSTIRLILSGYAEEKLFNDALQNNLAKLYMFKPWDNENFIRTIEQVIGAREILNSEETLKGISSIIGTLREKGLYEGLSFALEQVRDTQKALKKVAEDKRLERDTLDIVNSSFWEAQVGSIEEATGRLGEFNIKNIISAAVIFGYINKINPSVNKELLIKHATLTNRITDLIYRRLLKKNLSDIYLIAGLLHDIGRYAVLSIFTDDNDEVKANMQTLHQEIGGYILDHLDFTYPVIESALFRHSPSDSRVIYREIVSVVHIADYYAGRYLGENLEIDLDAGAFDFLGICKEDCDKVVDEIH
jgi:response regulator RpfG family c-di-GMP phosphodiesterase